MRGSGFVSGNNLYVDDVCCQRILGDGILQDLFVLQLHGLRNDQVLLVGGQLRFRAGYVKRGQRAYLQLLFVVAIQSLRYRNRLLLHIDVGAGIDQFPVGSDSGGHRRNRLLFKSVIRQFAIVLGDHDIAAIGKASESVQQLLL